MHDHEKQGVTVIFSTFNRAEWLKETMRALCELDLNGLDVEFVIIDNNSTDTTSFVIDEFSKKLPLVHLTETKPGKNCALNHALNKVNIKDIVVFTDDDVTPEFDWLQQIVSASNNYPESSVFGGKVSVNWPQKTGCPNWCSAEWLQTICFARHDMGIVDRSYPYGDFPIGPNFWVRRHVFDSGVRYNERLGPRPNKRLMGSETSFLMALAQLGYPPLYIPTVHVRHRIQPNELNKKAVYRRVFRAGRTKPYLSKIKNPEGFKLNPIMQLVNLIHGLISVCLSSLPGDISRRFSSRCGGIVRIGTALESFALLLRYSKFE